MEAWRIPLGTAMVKLLAREARARAGVRIKAALQARVLGLVASMAVVVRQFCLLLFSYVNARILYLAVWHVAPCTVCNRVHHPGEPALSTLPVLQDTGTAPTPVIHC